jgi:hypothetical protein
MRTEGDTTTSPINIIQAKVERSVLCVAIGQVTFNLTVTINRRTPRNHFLPLKLWALSVLVGAFALGAAAKASELPPDLKKQLKPFQIRSVVVDDGVVRVTMDRPFVKTAMVSNFYRAYCSPVWESPKRAWGGVDLKRIEVLNNSQSHGVAFNGGRKECMEAGNLAGGSAEYVARHTWVCVAGNPCRERRRGEKTAMDE